MDQLMWIVTFVALSLAVGMSIVAMRLLGGNRRQSAARIAALEAAASEIESDMEIEDDEPVFDDFRAADSAMFAATDEPRAPSRRWLAFAAVAILMAGLMGTAYALFKPAPLGASPSAPQPSTASPAVPAARMRPIELLSLKHTIDAATFTLTGLVQNPVDGAPLARVVAVVYLFDNDGAYFATGRADLEFGGLRPGEESPFVVKIPNTARVRRDDGAVIAHVDRRGQPTAGLMTEGRN